MNGAVPPPLGKPVPLSESSLRALGSPHTRPRVPSVASNASTLRSRLESETDYGGDDIVFHAPRPRHYSQTQIQPWLQVLDSAIPRSPSPLLSRVSSPLRPYSEAPQTQSTISDFRSISPPPSGNREHLEVVRPNTLHGSRMDSAARRYVRWMAKVGLKNSTIPSIIFFSIAARWLIGFGGHSGKTTPPMYGDYEAQRHWMELTVHLPFSQWYRYDLPYWGLDYPPLTAYVSLLCGYIGTFFNQYWFALDTSRGFESQASIAYMRGTVIALDACIYIPAAVIFGQTFWKSRSQRSQAIALMTVLLQPALILIDNGHFQYNSVMLGLSLWAMCLFQKGDDALAAIAFMLSLGFKQMALYYAPAIFAYCVGKCLYLGLQRGAHLFVQLAVAVVAAVIALFVPFVYPGFPASIVQVFVRMFPFGRGLFEDKVANFWCASNVIYKWRQSALHPHLPLISLAATLLGILPSVCHVLYISWKTIPTSSSSAPKNMNAATKEDNTTFRFKLLQNTEPTPTSALLPLSLFNSSMAFFMFSFQVHEKSILLPVMPFTFLMSAREDVGPLKTGVWEWGMLLNNTAVFSMSHLLAKDGQTLQYAILTLGWNYILGYNPLRMPSSFVKVISLAAYATFAILHAAQAIFNPPPGLPDLFIVLNVLVCTPIFGLCWLYGMKRQVEVGFAVSSR